MTLMLLRAYTRGCTSHSETSSEYYDRNLLFILDKPEHSLPVISSDFSSHFVQPGLVLQLGKYFLQHQNQAKTLLTGCSGGRVTAEECR